MKNRFIESKMTARLRILSRLEMICGIAWFFDDGFWLMMWRWPCYAACLLAVLTAVGIFFYIERRPVQIMMCAADTCWLTFNILWSVGDLESIGALNSAAKVFFFGGGLCFAGALLSADYARDAFALVLGRLRLFHLR